MSLARLPLLIALAALALPAPAADPPRHPDRPRHDQVSTLDDRAAANAEQTTPATADGQDTTTSIRRGQVPNHRSGYGVRGFRGR